MPPEDRERTIGIRWQSNRPVIPQSFTHDFFLLVNEGSHVAYVAFLIAVTP
jgi:hypothetical protein